ncbi:isopenicillin N synthase family dioxygenase [Croceicoccus naphthovorans]|uniref:2-oxoglutarate-dependent ethylene/succinate-forming enzyme n=1 Tax=Croceicoccus naphthovorans TaxID=1348774 RepID=A0A0G3XGN2_9SPHN|nr:2-oxoglutarate and iron-dependent oxygenase domain-containing protein [Croceicoccus naphthovorans]AKM10685.1 flavonol synthase [Croceicoccus naphthovorans]MBB3992173.1 isopenicillin N synthase-like dioxygenase [Croceicoccus naphthovorans]
MTSPIAAVSLTEPMDELADKLGRSFGEYGFAVVQDHGIDPDLIARAEDMSRRFFALPEDVKRRYFIAGGGGARGYTPFKTEIAKGYDKKDLKEFWHVGRTLPEGDPLAQYMAPNIWPEEIDGFRATFEALYTEFEKAGGKILRALAIHLGLKPDWFDATVDKGNSVMRLLHYPPIENADGAVRAAPHGDINTITLLLGAEEAGLELLSKQGEWIPVQPPKGALAVNIGDMLSRLTNDRLRSTIHQVRNPEGEGARRSRYSMPFFLHFRPDFVIETLPSCIDEAHPDQYPESLTAHDFLAIRLKEIGLM